MASGVMMITGAFGALGRAVLAKARQSGWQVVAVDASSEPPDEVSAAELVLSADLSDPASARRVVDQVRAHLGGLDALVNIAGGFVWSRVQDTELATWEHMVRLNLITCVNACTAALNPLQASPQGRIINVGAKGALTAGAGMGAYAASKAGVHRLTEALAEELKGSVTVNAILPSIIDTPANRAAMPDADYGAWVRPEELAAVILFLASPEASGVTGALIPVTGRV